VRPAADVGFRQVVQQQKARDQLQKSQLQQQLHQSVSDTAKVPMSRNPQASERLDRAEQSQQDRDRANDKALLDREERAQDLLQATREAAPRHD